MNRSALKHYFCSKCTRFLIRGKIMSLFSMLFLTVISFFHIFFFEVESVSHYDLFPPTPQFFEDKFWDSHSPSIFNRFTRNWVCRLPDKEKVKICAKVLEFVKKSQLTIEGLDTIHKIEDENVFRTVTLASRPNEKLQVKMFRCPLKYSFENSDCSVVIDQTSPGFYITRGTTGDSIFVLHDQIAHEDLPSVNSNGVPNLISERDDQSQFYEMGTVTSQQIQSVSEEQGNNASEETKDIVVPVLDGNQDVYVTALYKIQTKKQNGINQYEIIKVPDFSQMVKHMKKKGRPTTEVEPVIMAS